MTCEEVARLYEVNPEDCSLAEVAAVAAHVSNCSACMAIWQADFATYERTPETDEMADAISERIVNRVTNDPEALSVFLSGGPERD